jgi:hypothetical protein
MIKSYSYQQIVITDVRSWTEEIFEVVIVVVTGIWLYHCQFYHYKQFVIKIKNIKNLIALVCTIKYIRKLIVY